MKTEEIAVLALAGLAVWFIVKGRATLGQAQGKTSTYSRHAAPDYQGWQYFTDGVAISPDGVYYLNGSPVWSPS